MYLIARDTYNISPREGDDRRSHPGPLRENVTICPTQACTTPSLGLCPSPAPFEGPGPLFRKQKHFLKTAPKPLKAAPKPLKAGQPVWYTPGWGRYSQNVMFLRVYSSVRVATRTRAPIKCSTIVKSTLLGSLKPRLYRHFNLEGYPR